MFKKPNRNFRSKKVSSDEESDTQKEPAPQKEQSDLANFDKSNQILIESIKNKKKLESKLTSTILSFEADLLNEDEDDITEFKVKKSKQSRRITKELKKSKKEKERQIRIDKGEIFQDDLKNKNKIEVLTSEDVLFNEGITVKPLNLNNNQDGKKESKYLINKYMDQDKINSEDELKDFEDYKKNSNITSESDDDENRRLDSLRKEMQVLNGEEEDTFEDEEDEAKKSMKIMLKSGIIPDATMIHQARKKREMARATDYIPINNGRQLANKSKSRLVREDDDDVSDEDGNNDEPVSLNFKQRMKNERQKDRDNFLAYENGSDEEKIPEDNNIKYTSVDTHIDEDEEDENEEERWEKEQIRKGVQISQTLPSKLDFNKNGRVNSHNLKLMQHILGSNTDEIEMEIEPKISDLDILNNLPEVTFSSIKLVLNRNLKLLQGKYQQHIREHEMSKENLKANQTDYEHLRTIRPSLDLQYVYYQEMKAFIKDFVDCYNEKMEDIENAESKWLELMKTRANKFIERRQNDVKDQSIECSKKPIDSAHEERSKYRKLRRETRKKIREKKNKIKIHLSKSSDSNTLLHEGLSSDDDENKLDFETFETEKKKIVTELNESLISETNENFYEFNLIKARFEKWNSEFNETYKNAYISLSLPKLFSPLVRLDIINWNPLDKKIDPNFLENSKWFKELLTYNREEMLKILSKTDTEIVGSNDFLLIPYVIEKNVVLKLIYLTETVFDPVSTSQTENFVNLISKIVNDYSTINYKSVNTKRLFEIIVERLKKCCDNDVYIPLYPKMAIENKESESSQFFHRQFWLCVKVFRNILKWKGVLNDRIIKEYSLDFLLNRYLMIGLQSMEANMGTLEIIEYLISSLPKEWLKNNPESRDNIFLPQLVNIGRIIRRIADNINQKEFETKLISKKIFSDHLRKIKNVLISIGAVDQAIQVGSAYDF